VTSPLNVEPGRISDDRAPKRPCLYCPATSSSMAANRYPPNANRSIATLAPAVR